MIKVEAETFKERVAELKKDSSYYPTILFREYLCKNPVFKKELFISTLVRVKRDDKWYVIHFVENQMFNKKPDIKGILLRAINSIHNIQNLYKLTGVYEDLDTLQISEEERLSNEYKKV